MKKRYRRFKTKNVQLACRDCKLPFICNLLKDELPSCPHCKKHFSNWYAKNEI